MHQPTIGGTSVRSRVLDRPEKTGAGFAAAFERVLSIGAVGKTSVADKWSNATPQPEVGERSLPWSHDA